MNLLKTLNAKREIREMLLVKCATSQMVHGRRMTRLQRLSGIAHGCFCIFVPYVFWTLLSPSNSLEPFELGVMAYIGYSWHTSERELQLLRLIQHYREEEED
jgi:hypothetical protein